MPSDNRMSTVLEALRASITVYQAALRAAGDRMDALLTANDSAGVGALDVPELGEFGAQRIDVTRFAALNEARWGAAGGALDDHERALIAAARRLLGTYLDHDPRRFMVDVPSGGRMSSAVAHALAELGRPFGAAMVVELLRRGRYDADEDKAMLHGFPRHRWSRAERDASPPLVVGVDGADLRAGELASLLDGNQRFALVVRSPAPPAALVRLITPGTLVFQTTSEVTLRELFAQSPDSPAVGALVPEGAAEFVHVPDAGRPMHERLTITAKPSGSRKPLPGWTMWQQDQELQQLIALATGPAAAARAPAPATEPAERLAAWLLSQADAPAARESA